MEQGGGSLPPWLDAWKEYTVQIAEVAIEKGLAVYERVWIYLSSIDVRQDTKLSLGIGAALGIVLLIAFSFSPGDPIDYSILGGGLHSQMSSKKPEGVKEGSVTAHKKDDGDDVVNVGEAADASQGSKVLKGGGGEAGAPTTSSLRQRKPGASTCEGDGSGSVDSATKETEDGGVAENEDCTRAFDPDKDINEEKIVRKLTNNRAGKLLGLTEAQVRDAIKEARAELKDESRTVNNNPTYQRGSLTATVDIIVYTFLIGALIYFLNRDYNSVFTRVMYGLFPREMSTIGVVDPTEELRQQRQQ